MLLAERHDTLETLTSAFESCLRGQSRLLVVEGAGGSGKTRVLRAFTDHVTRSGGVLLNAHCDPVDAQKPFAVVHQLLQSCEARTLALDPVARRLHEQTLRAMLAGPVAGGAPELASAVRYGTLQFLRQQASRRQLVITIDDAHHMDPPSSHCLLDALRRLAASPVLVAVSASTDVPQARALFHDDLLREPTRTLVRLGLLSDDGVRQMLVEALGPEAGRHAVAVHNGTGGNPLFVQAVIEDHRARPGKGWAPDDHGTGVVCRSFGRAVVSCLHRTSARTRRLAQGLAVLGADGSPTLVARLLDLEPNAVERGLEALRAVGIADGHRFRHQRAVDAVLEDMLANQRADLHRRAAAVLHEEGAASVRTIAEHLLAAGARPEQWAVGVLQDAARTALTDGEHEFAHRCLVCATLAGGDEGQLATTRIMLLDLAWRVDPTSVERHVNGLVDVARRGHLGTADVATLVRHLLRKGRVDEAADLIDGLRASAMRRGSRDRPLSCVRALQLWLSYTYPPLAHALDTPEASTSASAVHAENRRGEHLLADADHEVVAVQALAEVIANRADSRHVHDARLVLRGWPAVQLSWDAMSAALMTLVHTDQLEESSRHCRRLLNEADRMRSPTWRALIMSVRGEVQRRLGDLRGAASSTRSALDLLPLDSWGAWVGSPLSSLVLTTLALGDIDEASRLVEQPVLPGQLQGRHGLAYRHALGRFHLAVGRPKAALDDFLGCAELARRWQLDMPTTAPWRSGAAEALLRLGDPQQARALLGEQLLLVGHRFPRVRGVTLRLLAHAVPLDERRDALVEAVELLRACGDRVELAHALHDLGGYHGATGDARRARIQIDMARSIARQCGAGPLHRSTPTPEPLPPLSEKATRLTHAERRVAVLAAQGNTNREIAERLFVTPSTIEQHLTRVFRKLGVKQREQLPDELGLWQLDPA